MPAAGRGQRHLAVKVVGNGERDQVDLFHGQELAIILKGVGDAAFLGEMLRLARGARRDGNHLRAGNHAEGGRMYIADETAADDADFGHVRKPLNQAV